MITRIELVNFMSHAHTVIEPAAGLTVLVGPNNIGKSAVVAALQILCHNENSTYVLRHGEKECSVTIQTDDNHTIEWRRKTSPSYVIDGQTFDRLRNSGLPDELHLALRLPKVDGGGDADFDVHFGAQKAPIFLLASSPANAARFFASSSDAIRLMTIQKLHKEKLSEAQREKVRLEGQSRKLNAELEVLEPVIGVERRLDQAECSYEELLQAEAWFSEANQREAALAAQLAAEIELAARETALRPLSSPPALFPTGPLEKLTRELESAIKRYEDGKSHTDLLAELPPVPQLSSTENLAELIDIVATANLKQMEADLEVASLVSLLSPPTVHEIVGLHKLIEDMDVFHETIKCNCRKLESLLRVSAPPALLDTESLEELRQRFEFCTEEIERLKSRHGLLETIAAAPKLAKEGPLHRLVEALSASSAWASQIDQSMAVLSAVAQPPVPSAIVALSAITERLENTDTRLRQCNDEFEAAEANLMKAASELRASAAGKTCPICGNQLDPDRLVANAAAGLKDHGHA